MGVNQEGGARAPGLIQPLPVPTTHSGPSLGSQGWVRDVLGLHPGDASKLSLAKNSLKGSLSGRSCVWGVVEWRQ